MTDLVALKREARHKKASSGRLEELARNADSTVQLAVVGNPNTPSVVLEYLGWSTKLGLLKALTKNPNTPPDMHERLARHRRETVRQAVARWVELSEVVALEQLRHDKDADIASKARKRLE